MEYICDKIIHVTKFEKIAYILQKKLSVELLGEFFNLIHELNLRPFRNLKFLDEISFKKCVFFSFLNNKCTMITKI
jgi:hypothetical protein